MISIRTIDEIAHLAKSRHLSALQSLSSIAASLREEWERENSLLNFISDIFSCNSATTGEEVYDITPETMEFAEELYSSGKEVAFTTKIQNVIKVKVLYNESEDCYPVYVNDQYIGKLDHGSLDDVHQVHASALKVYVNDIYSQAQATGCKYALADIADAASTADWVSDTNVSNALYAKIREYSDILGVYSNDLISAVAKGPTALIQSISYLISQAKQTLDNGNLSTLLNSTNIVLNHFAWGIVAQTIGSVVTALSVVLVSVSRIAAAITALAGVIMQVVGRIAVSATTAFDDTQYSLLSGSDVIHAFAFVVEQDIITNVNVASYMRSKGWNTMTVFCPHQGSVYLMYLDEYDNPNNNDIHYEVHLSSDVDVSQQLLEMEIENTGYFMPYISLNNADVDPNSKPCGIGYYPSVTNLESGYWQSPFWINKYLGSGGTTLGNIAYSLRQYASKTPLVSPIDFDMFDILKQWYSNDLTNFLDVRLCSALILWVTYRLSSTLQFDSLAGNDMTAWGLRIYSSLSNNILSKFFNLFYTAWSCFVTDSGVGQQHYLRDSFGLTQNNRDALLSAISSVFDGLNYKQTAVSADIVCKRVQVHGENGTIVFTENSWVSNVTQAMQLAMLNGATYFVSLYSSYYSQNYLTWSSGVWNNHFSVTLPTLTFTGFIFGLIVDGLLLAATALVATAVVAGWINIRNYRARLQAEAEYAWYNYQDNGQTDELWKSYKSHRFKYNIIALATGGSTLRLGLYDDDNSISSIISSLRGVLNVGEDEDNVNIKTIVRLIKGSV